MLSEFPHSEIRRLIDSGTPFALVAYSPGWWQLFAAETGDDKDDSISIYNFGKENKGKVTLYDNGNAVAACEKSAVKASKKVQSREEYTEAVACIVDLLGKTGGKTVYSRRKHMSSSVHPADAAAKYFASHPKDFCYIYQTPDTGLWFGATPELIARKDPEGEMVVSMALAGTKPADDTTPWDGKNIEEHRFVLDYICDTFRECGLEPMVVDDKELVTGAVKHLRHTVIGLGKADITDLTLKLSPTPAICGTPSETALRQIAEFEPLPRLCYGGEIVLKTKSQHVSYLNLRCALASTDDGQTWDYNIFCGGGITAKSDPETEWIETELKAKSLAEALM